MKINEKKIESSWGEKKHIHLLLLTVIFHMRHQDIRENATIETLSHHYVESLITGRKTICFFFLFCHLLRWISILLATGFYRQ